MRVPKSWDQVSIEQFLNYRAALEMRDMDNIDRSVQLLSALTSTPVAKVEALTVRQVNALIAQINFTHSLPSPKARRYLFVKGRLFKACINPADMTPAQLVDLSLYTRTKESTLDNIHNILAVICGSPFGKYDGKGLPKRADFFYKHLSIQVAYSLSLFFCKLLKASYGATEDFLMQTTNRKMTEAIRQISTISTGAGTSPSTG